VKSLHHSRVDRSAQSLHVKDEILDNIADVANVAQFVSFSPGDDPKPRLARIRGMDGYAPHSLDEAVRTLMEHSPEGLINVRSFDPAQPKGNPFERNLATVEEATDLVCTYAARGLFTIVNESIDVKDGGVSGVAYGGLLEFGPGDTPRIVDHPGTASMPFELGLEILHTVYGFKPELSYPIDVRVEFSIHPLRRGVRSTHTIIWELETIGDAVLKADPFWPNLFSRHIGDKTFGLLVADAIGLAVPETVVICRNVAPFRFGRQTGTAERWIRTSPAVQTPGRFTTQRGWTDPFTLMSREDPTCELIASVLDQEGVDARYSGAAVLGPNGDLTVEGVAGFGDAFMVGAAAPQELPNAVREKVAAVYGMAAGQLGPVRFEWVMDDERVWVVQLHRGSTMTSGGTIYPGNPSTWREFNVKGQLEGLRSLIDELSGRDDVGVVLIGQVGVTSHFGDLLRRARIPSRVQ
jgi:hypothetical protein